MDVRIPKVCIPTKSNRPCDELRNSQNCIQSPLTATTYSETGSGVQKSAIIAEGSAAGKPNVVSDWQVMGLDGDVASPRNEDDGMSDEDEGTYAVVIDDTLSMDSSSPEPRCEDVKSEVVDNWGDAVPYNVLKSSSTTQTMVNVAEGVSYYGDASYPILGCLSPRSTLGDTRHVTDAPSSSMSSFKTMGNIVKQEPPECSGQFTYSMSSLELEGQLVDQAIDNLMTLPQVFTEVVESKNSQSAEIQLQQLKLASAQKEYEEAVKENKALLDEISSVSHDIVHTHQAVVKGEKQCDALRQEVANYVSICEDIQQTVSYKQEEYDLEKSKIESYQLKIADHVRTVDKHENQSDTMIELRQLEEDVKGLRNKKIEIELNKEGFGNMKDGTSEKQIADKLSHLKEELETQTKAAEDKTKLTEDLKDQQKLLEQSVLVLHKRNAAQLTRLKRQLKEAQIRKRRWNDQISQLGNVVSDLKKQLLE
ncbi:uncharacterized protein LOC117335164 [Pecten maximus]|uniref:uncharacterized protein LOC117335164 n=1 Tax=Pecten maximus TaxID=6579 RepID=UPI001458C147|nr:uncharacterized protein LOC117335164 [Pecten maximus]